MDPNAPRGRKVLLARPNDFFVGAMRSVIERAGFEPVALHSLEDCAAISDGELAGAVISTAVTSAVSEPLGRVFTAIRAKYPGLPVAVATMLADGRSAEQLLRSELPDTPLVASLGSPASMRRLGDPDVLLLLRQQDLGGDDSAGAVAALRSHFGRGSQ